MHRNDIETSEHSSTGRLHTLARLFATAILRLHTRAALVIPSDENRRSGKSPKSSETCLEFSRETVLSVHTG